MMRRLVIVDDHDGFRAVARALLAADGFDVVGEARDGESAIAEVLRQAPDVVLLDVELPDMNGFEVARRLAAAGCPAVVVLTSSRDRADYGPMVDESPAHGFVPKGDLSGEAVRSAAA
jgi:two-component system nitrate/nitrite response regulator NarL